MSTLRVSNIEAKADASSPTIDEKVKVTDSQGRVLLQVDGKTSGITTVGINTSGNTFTVNANNGVTFAGIVTATTFSGSLNATSGPVLIGSGTSTGTASQPLQVTGGAYVSGSLAIGTTSGSGKLIVQDSLPKIQSNFNGTNHFELGVGGSGCGFAMSSGLFMTFNHQPYADRGTDNNLTERMRLDSSGNLQLSSAGTSLLNSSGRKILNQTGGILQVVQTLKTDSFTTTSTSFTDVTGLSVSITPSSTSSKILVMTHIPFARDGTGSDAFVKLVRVIGGTSTDVGNGNSGYFGQAAGQYGLDPVTGSRIYLDSPSTTSSITYKIQTYTANNTVYIGTRRLNDFIMGADITVMEISG